MGIPAPQILTVTLEDENAYVLGLLRELNEEMYVKAPTTWCVPNRSHLTDDHSSFVVTVTLLTERVCTLSRVSEQRVTELLLSARRTAVLL